MSNEDAPSAKRQRTEDVPQHSDIWYNDGSVVLQAENTQFRVHWTILAQHSSFFRQLRELPQPADQPTIEGCSVVELPDDAVDVEHLLRILYDLKLLFQPALQLPVVAALIRLGRKYDFRELLDSAVERVTFENPRTLKEFDALLCSAGRYVPTRIVMPPCLLPDLLRLARENDIVSALPSLYLRAIGTLSLLLDGLPGHDGSLISLDPVDLRRCVLGREKLMNVQYIPGYTWGWLETWSDNPDCPTPLQCSTWRERKIRSGAQQITLRALTWLGPTSSSTSLCSGCRRRSVTMNLAGRKKVWEEVPGFFDLPPWDELKNDL
ncbi:hypothetical protein C8R47DRAFT_973953 [Mycena vitilis]|nr:hypothetical protein C8R47DRAFT_973953 [Mycena vitilis]